MREEEEEVEGVGKDGGGGSQCSRNSQATMKWKRVRRERGDVCDMEEEVEVQNKGSDVLVCIHVYT